MLTSQKEAGRRADYSYACMHIIRSYNIPGCYRIDVELIEQRDQTMYSKVYVQNSMHTLNGMCPNKPVSDLVHNISVQTKVPSFQTGTQYWCRNHSCSGSNLAHNCMSKCTINWYRLRYLSIVPNSKLAYNCMSKCRLVSFKIHTHRTV